MEEQFNLILPPAPKGKPPLDQIQWDFSEVKKAELEERCVREYALESNSILELKRETDQVVAAAIKRREVDFDFQWPPLCSASEALREQMIRHGKAGLVAGRYPVVAVPPSEWSPLYIGGWEDARDAKERHDDHIRINKKCKDGVFIPYKPLGREPIVLLVNWAEYNDRKIKSEFAAIIKTLRPIEFRKVDPKRRGVKIANFGNALKWLSVMRALHHRTYVDPKFTLSRRAETQRTLPANLRRLTYKECLKLRRKAGKCFQELFPFLPVAEVPRSWETAHMAKRAR